MILLTSPIASSTPFIEPDNRWLRSDIQTLVEAGVITAPVTQWPIMWASLGGDLESANISKMNEKVNNAFIRVNKAYQRASNSTIQGHQSITAATDAAVFREFGDGAREETEIESALDWVGESFAAKLQFQAVNDPFDDEEFRLDGSYLGFVWGNWVFSGGAVDRWWGPGWKNSLILSNNARSIPALSIQRNKATAFETPWLSWIGPWTFETFMGQLESERAISNALIWGARGTFKPAQFLEIGLSRTAIWGGDGRSKGFSTFIDVLASTNENGGNGLTTADDPSNQQAGVDIKWNLNHFGVPLSTYLQYIGDDKLIDGIPSKAIVSYGIESSQFIANWGSYHLFLEYSNTSVSGFKGIRTDDTIFEHSLFQSGYRFRGRTIGPTFDNDSEVITLGFIGSNYENQELSVNYSYMDLNRDNSNKTGFGGNPITDTAFELNTLELRYRFYMTKSYFDIEASLYDDDITAFNLDMSNRLSVTYHYEF